MGSTELYGSTAGNHGKGPQLGYKHEENGMTGERKQDQPDPEKVKSNTETGTLIMSWWKHSWDLEAKNVPVDAFPPSV